MNIKRKNRLFMIVISLYALNIISMDNKESSNYIQHANLQVSRSEDVCPYEQYELLLDNINIDLENNGALCLNNKCIMCSNYSNNLDLLLRKMNNDFSFLSFSFIRDTLSDYTRQINKYYLSFYIESINALTKKVSLDSHWYQKGIDTLNNDENKNFAIFTRKDKDDIGFLLVDDSLSKVVLTNENVEKINNLQKHIKCYFKDVTASMIDVLTRNNAYMKLATLFVEESENTGKKMMSAGFTLPQD